MAEKPIKQRKTANPDAREQRRKTIAAGIVARRPMTEIAAQVGLTREMTSKIANALETKDLIRSMLAPHHKRLERIVDNAIGAVERAVQSDQAQRADRIRWLQDRIEKLRTVIEERSKAPEVQAASGGKTGMIVHRLKSVGSGPAATVVDEYEVDTGLLKELREHERQLREELNNFDLTGVARAKDLLEMAEGKRTDGDGSTTGLRFAGTMEELLCYYRELAIVGRPSLP